MTCSCGGKVLTVYIRQGKPLRWVPLGKMCIQCKTWEGEVYTPATPQVDSTAPTDEQLAAALKADAGLPLTETDEALLRGLGAGAFPPPDAQGIPRDSPRGKATLREQYIRLVSEATARGTERQILAYQEALKPPCTCGPGERVKGKHNRHCLARG